METPTEEAFHELQQLVSELTHRVNFLEAELAAFPHRHADDPTQDEMLAISAAVAAFLGHRASIKQLHVRRRGSWSRQGREGIQESHAVTHHAPRHPLGGL